jgi:hypothetical protein
MTTSLSESVPDRTQVPITLRALIQRINRKLAHQEEVLKKARGLYAYDNLPDYYIVHWHSNQVLTWHVDPVAYARELGVLNAWETVAEEA